MRALQTRKQRRSRAIAWFKNEKEEAEAKLASAEKKRRGCQIVQNIAEAVNNKGEVTVRIFDAIHASTKGVDKGGKIAAIYTKGGRQAMAWVHNARAHWAKHKVEVQGESGESVERRQLECAIKLALQHGDGEGHTLLQRALHMHMEGNCTVAEALNN